MIIGLHHVHLFCQDVEESAKFFKDVFEAQETQRGILGGKPFIRIHLKGLVLNLQGTQQDCEQLDPGKGKAGLDHFCLKVEDMSNEIAKFQKKGVKILAGPGIASTGNKYAFLQGPDGTRIELLELK